MVGQGGLGWILRPWNMPLASLLGIALPFCCTGCAGLWDEVTSRDFRLKEHFKASPPPLEVLQTSTDGDKRSKALAKLKEPQQSGGTSDQQDLVIKVLVDAATNDRQSLCRIRAIECLRNFKDPRAVEGLKEAYYRAGSFNPEIASVIRAQSLEALGITSNPEALELLVKVANEPTVVGAEQDRQMKIADRPAAARALGHFPEGDASNALVNILRQDKDVAIRDVARTSLVKMTGHKAPPDARLWEEYLAKDQAHHDSTWIKLTNFWK